MVARETLEKDGAGIAQSVERWLAKSDTSVRDRVPAPGDKMGKHILVLGGGHIGSVVAEDLSIDTNHAVTVADKKIAARIQNTAVHIVECDLTPNIMRGLIDSVDVVVNALPSKMAADVWYISCIKKKPLVDVSYQQLYQNWDKWDTLARKAGIPIIIDTGVAPGLTNLVAGLCWSPSWEIKSGKLFVGGMAKDPAAPYGYATTWSLEDLYEEYTRKAAYIDRGVTCYKDALSGIEEVFVPGVGFMEGFLTDGMRSLLTMPNVKTMFEKTMRHPGHVEAIQPLLKDKEKFIGELHKCRDVDDILVLFCDIDGRQFRMIEEGQDGMTAMQRTTALTTSIITKLVAGDRVRPGLQGLEHLAKDFYHVIVDELSTYGVILEELKGKTKAP